MLTLLACAHTAQAAPESRTVLVNGSPLHYVREGSGSPLVLIHGTYSSTLVYQMSVFETLAQRYDVTALDLPGYGKSKRPKKNMTLDERVEMVHSALRELGIKNPVLVGHSSGGAFVLRYAMNYPGEISGLVLVTPYIEPYDKADLRYRIASKPVLGDFFVYGLIKPLKFFKHDASFAKPGFYPDPVREDYAKLEVGQALRRKTFRYNGQDLVALGPALKEMNSRYGEIKVPVTILAGDMDPIASPELNANPLHEKIPQSKLILLKKTGHQPLFTKSTEVIAAIDEIHGPQSGN